MANEQAITTGDKPKGGLVNFFRETRRETAKVTWPTRREITLTTTLIVVFAIVAGLFFLFVDTALGYVVSRLLGMSQ
jgi:preprotein translocase subunit SecE